MAKVQAKAKENKPKKKQTLGMKILTVVFSVVSVFYVLPVFIVLMNSFKTNAGISSEPFAFPDAETFYGVKSYITGMFYGNFPFYKTILCSLFITIGGVILILVCTSMCAWYLSRSNSLICKIIYYFCIFSMVVPFQMVMFTLSKTADKLNLTTPWGILIIYLGFGAGLAVFMFTGFVKSIPIEIEEAADVDGAGPLRTFFGVVLPIMKPTFISVGILETMWIWNDYLLPYLILDKGKYKTIPIHIQYLNGSYGHTDTSAIMALIVLSIVPIVIFYFACQKYIIEGVVAGAVKG
jgi:raffinose/stachyose/melibiose transport system permease protein